VQALRLVLSKPSLVLGPVLFPSASTVTARNSNDDLYACGWVQQSLSFFSLLQEHALFSMLL